MITIHHRCDVGGNYERSGFDYGYEKHSGSGSDPGSEENVPAASGKIDWLW